MTDAIVATTAYEVNSEVIACRMNIEANFLRLARLLKQVRDEKLYRALDHVTFESYLGDPEIGIKRSSAYKLITEYERYVLRLGVPETRLIGIGSKKLSIIGPVVERDKDEWLGRAEALSSSDLIAEVRNAQGKPPLLPAPAPQAGDNINPGVSGLREKYKTYLDYVRDQPCCVCGADPVDPHHFPVTKGAGGKEVEEWAIPLCRECHDEFQNHKLKFLNDYSHKWAGYYYGLILKIWEPA